MSLEARWRLRVQDILDAVRRIATYVDGLSAEAFYADQRTIDAVVRNIEIIGEAARHVPDSVRGAISGDCVGTDAGNAKRADSRV